DVRDKNSCIKVEPMIYIEVITGIGFRKIFVRPAQVPLPAASAGIIAWRGHAEHPSHRKDSCADILPMEIAAKADLLDLDFIGAKSFSRAAQTVILRMIEAADVIRIKAYFRGEK